MNNVTPIERPNFVPSINIDDFVPRNFEMNPETDIILDGTELKVGMVIIQEDVIFREDPKHVAAMTRDDSGFDYEFMRLKRNNRFGKIVKFFRNHPAEQGYIQKILLEYPDGVQSTITINSSYTWIVRKDSIDA